MRLSLLVGDRLVETLARVDKVEESAQGDVRSLAYLLDPGLADQWRDESRLGR